MKEINILGTPYTISKATQKEDSTLVQNNGYCDRYTKKIVIANDFDDGSVEVTPNIEEVERRITRHEIVHAFLYESGLNSYTENETLVDWIAIQFPKMYATFKELDII